MTGLLIAAAAGWYFNEILSTTDSEQGMSQIDSLSISFLNLNPEVKYVGDEDCSTCHLEIYKTYKKSGMGLSFQKPSTGEVIEEYRNDNKIYDEISDFHYEMIEEGGEFFQVEFRLNEDNNRVHELRREADWIVGSGRHARTYLTLSNGFLYEMPVTWYSEKGKWDLSPGYQTRNQRFSRPIIPECMNCHNSYPEHVEYSENKYKNIPGGIGCERCHGPGELHSKSRYGWKLIAPPSGRIDLTIVNPARLPRREQMDVCLQCHLVGVKTIFREGEKSDGFRPGMKLSDWKSVYISDDLSPDNFDIASHGERTSLSACYIESGGALTCIVCHDPHLPLKMLGREHYTEKCIGCHAAESLSADKKGTDHEAGADCVSCHMKQGATADVLHVNFTDHWIRKFMKFDNVEQRSDEIITLKSFMEENDPAAGIRLGMAYVRYFEEKHSETEYLFRAQKLLTEGLIPNQNHTGGWYNLGKVYLSLNKPGEALSSLRKAVELNPDHMQAHFAKGIAYEKVGEYENARRSYLNCLRLFPEDTQVLTNLGNLEHGFSNYEKAIEYYYKAVESDPSYSGSYANLGRLYFVDLKDAVNGRKFIEKALHYDPDFPTALHHLGSIELAEGNVEESIRIFERAIEIDPRYVPAHGNLAGIYTDRGDFNNARRYLIKLLEIEPNNKRALDMLSRIESQI